MLLSHLGTETGASALACANIRCLTTASASHIYGGSPADRTLEQNEDQTNCRQQKIDLEFTGIMLMCFLSRPGLDTPNLLEYMPLSISTTSSSKDSLSPICVSLSVCSLTLLTAPCINPVGRNFPRGGFVRFLKAHLQGKIRGVQVWI